MPLDTNKPEQKQQEVITWCQDPDNPMVKRSSDGQVKQYVTFTEHESWIMDSLPRCKSSDERGP